MRYICRGCNRELEEDQVWNSSQIGRMCLLCRDGRVTPLPEPPKEPTR